VRIAVVNQHLRDVVAGGSELQCHLLADGLAARGHDVVYAAVGGSTDQHREAVGGRPHEFRYQLISVPNDPEALARAVVDLAPDVVYWRHNRRGVREVARALAHAAVPLVFAIAHVDDVSPWPSWPAPDRNASLRDRASDLRSRVRWRRQLTAFGDVSAIASQRTDLIGRVPLDTVALQRHVPNIMDPHVEPFAWPRRYVAWVGNLKPRKRPELIPSIADALEAHGIDLVVAGPAQDARYRWLTEPQAAHPNLHHVGAPSPAQVTGLLAGARCLAVTAMPEGFSNVMIQAWWGGTPTVTLDYDPDGVVVAQRLGSVAEGDVARFISDVVRIATDPDPGMADAGARAAVWARAQFAPAAVLDALERLLGDVVARRASTR